MLLSSLSLLCEGLGELVGLVRETLLILSGEGSLEIISSRGEAAGSAGGGEVGVGCEAILRFV